mmetsp:Transcript_39313/g.35009  ORF Transcript_39313/g.35009 Transcript_39313/m.35009 type:complete len:141 (+) Transcript_39313:102-524(+)
MVAQYCISNPNDIYNTLSKVYSLLLAYPLRRVFKYAIKYMTHDILVSVPLEYSFKVFDIVKLALGKMVIKFNQTTNISFLMNNLSSGLMDVPSEMFQRIRYNEFFEHSTNFSIKRGKLAENFITFKNIDSLAIHEYLSLL